MYFWHFHKRGPEITGPLGYCDIENRQRTQIAQSKDDAEKPAHQLDTQIPKVKQPTLAKGSKHAMLAEDLCLQTSRCMRPPLVPPKPFKLQAFNRKVALRLKRL